MGRGTLIKLLIAVILLIIGALVAGAYFDFNPAIPIFVVLGFGIYMVGRIGGPQLPEGTHVSFGDTYGVYLHREDFVPPDTELKWREDKEAARAYAEREPMGASIAAAPCATAWTPPTPRRRVNRPL
jgi:hypothetical protein